MANEITEVAPLNVLVIGGMTALGREVARRLSAAGHHVVVTATDYEDAPLARADGAIPAYPNLLRAGELRSLMQAFKTDVVVNAAPQAMNHLPQLRPELDAALVDEGVSALIEAARASEVKFIVHTSFAYAGEHHEALDGFLEAVRTGERHVLDLKVPGCVLRFGFMYGAEQPTLVKARETLLRGGFVDAGHDDAPVHWISVPDAASAVIAAINARPSGALLEIVDDQPVTPAGFMRYFTQSLGIAEPGRTPAFAVWAQPSKAQRALMALHPQVSNREAKDKLGWQPRFASYEQGIDDALLSWRATAGA